LTAADVVYSLRHDNTPSWALAYTQVASIEQTGPYQITVKTTHPDTLFFDFLPFLEIGEKTYQEAKGGKYGTAGGGLMCTGPYELQKWTPGASIVLRRNPNYWNTSSSPRIGTVTFVFHPGGTALYSALETGAIDGAYDLPAGAVHALGSATNGNLYYSPRSIVIDDLYPAQPTGPMGNVLVRRALSIAIPRTQIANVLYDGYATPLRVPMNSNLLEPPATPANVSAVYQREFKTLVPENLPEAKRLVQEAGAVAKKPIVLEIQAGNTNETDIATVIQQVAQGIGLNIVVRAVPESTLTAGIYAASSRKGVDLIYLSPDGSQNQDPLTLLPYYLGSGASVNMINYKNPQALADLESAERTTDAVAKATYMARVMTDLANSGFVIPVVADDAGTFVNKRLAGATLTTAYMAAPWLTAMGGK
jgi:peptide/nickel transport system substrate-binding protein